MEHDATTHPDEGTIHAWLDGALDAAAAERIAAHVRGCAACEARVAEARGLIAGASRIVRSLDDVPTGTGPVWTPGDARAETPGVVPIESQAARQEGSLWRRLRVTPTRAAIAATLIVGVGITLTRQRTAVDSPRARRPTSVAVTDAPASDAAGAAGSGMAGNAAAAAPAPAATRPQDHLLDSAIARNLAQAQPPRAMSAAKGVAIPQAPVDAGAASSLPDTTAGERVAEGRRSVERERVGSIDEMADKLRTRLPAQAAPAAPGEEPFTAKSASASTNGRIQSANVATVAPSGAVSAAGQCFRIESEQSGARWGGEALPLVITADSAARAGVGSAYVLTAEGRPSALQARWVRASGDSVRLVLRGVGFAGSIELGANLMGSRVGVAHSVPSGSALEGAVVTGYGERPAAQGAVGGRARSVPAQVPAAEAPAKGASAKATPGSAVPVTMRPVACPVR